MSGSATPTVLYHQRGPLMLLLTGRAVPSAAEWTRYVLELEALGKRHAQVILLVVAEDAGPTSAQRDELAKHAPKGIRTSVVTASAIARSITTLIGWLDPNIRSFSPAAINAAFDYLAVPRDERPAVLKQVASMRVRLSGVGVSTDEVAAGLLEGASIEPMFAIVQPLSKLRAELVARRRA